MIEDYFNLALKNLKKRGVRSWLTLLGILIGVAAVVSLVSLGGGLKAAVDSQFNIGSTEVLTVQAGGMNNYGPPGSGASNPLTKEDAGEIGKLSTVEVSIPRNIRNVKLEFNKKVSFTYAGSIPDNQREMDYVYDFVGLETISGKLLESGDRGVIVIGSNLADMDKNGLDKNIKVGDNVAISGKTFRVQGITKKMGSIIMDSTVLMTENDMEDLLDYGNEVDLIVVKAVSKDLINQTAEDINKLMRDRRDVKKGQEDFDVSTPQAMLESVNQIISGIQIFIIIIASISIAVGAIGITNTMTTSVLERRKEIGIMKAIGARNEHIFYLFFIEAGLLGMIGGIIGVLLGTAVGYAGTSALNTFLGVATHPEISFWLILLTMTGSFLIGAVSGLIPALNAAKENPVEGIRG
ncbi:hypothetical protein COU59_02000 [Candidatus Pacearchaeota archaeon CG10_big_fil_rev_8_21_14_0_10_34_12]|nr:MAG: hypothetical protein COU59_02000 [Candidatus Pacearchaeota archaeon CG10_big_fil_rev_8_21_14_0_10_34_12]